MDNGTIKLSRNVLFEDWFRNSKTAVVFIYLLLDAEREDKYRGYDKISRGEIDTTNEIIAGSCGLTVQNTRYALAYLEKIGEIRRERRNHYQIITIVNFEKYAVDD